MRTTERKMKPIYLLTAAMSLGYSTVFTLLAKIRDDLGFTNTGVGMIAFAGLGMGFAAHVCLSRFADRGHARSMVRLGIALAAAAMVWTVVAQELWQWVGARMLLGLGSGMVSPAVRRVVIASDPSKVGANLGRQLSFDLTGFVVGPVVAAVLAGMFGLRAPFVVLALTYLGLLVIVWRLDLRAGIEAKSPRVVRSLLAEPAVQAALCAAIAFYMTVGTFEALWSLLLADLGAQTWLVGATLSFFAIPAVALAPIAGRAAQSRGAMRVVTAGLVVATACTLGYGFAPLWIAVALSAVHAIADAFTMPANQVGVAMSTPMEQIAAGQGLLSGVGLAVAGISALIASRVYDGAGRATVFGATAATMFAFVALARVLGSRVRSRAATVAPI